MAPLPIPTAGVRYRIENVELSTFLERDSQGNVATLRRRSNRPAQLWLLEDSNGLFKIINADDRSYMLSATRLGTRFILSAEQLTPGTTQLLDWKLIDSLMETFYIVNNNNILLHLDKANAAAPILTRDRNILPATTANNLNQSKGPEDRWRIVEDSPTALPDGTGTYIIQTLKGDAIQSGVDRVLGRVKLAFKYSYLGEEHKWEIEDLGNGKATIKNTHVNEYIDAQQVGWPAEWTPVLLKITPPAEPPKWDIKKLGNSLFSITVDKLIAPQIRPTPLALTVLNDVIVLKKYMDVQSQQWSLVPTELASFKPMIMVSPNGSLPVGEYALFNNLKAYYAWVDSAGTLQASPTDRGFYFKFDLAAGNDGAGLGNVFISHLPSYPSGSLTMPDDPLRATASLTNERDIWCVQMKGSPKYFFIIHVPTARRLMCYYPDGNYQGQPQIGLEIPNDRHSNGYWTLIPKP